MKDNRRKSIIKEYLYKEDGAAMIIVLCVMAIVLAVCLSLLLAAYQMFASVNDSAKDDIYYHQAMSCSMEIQAQLEDTSDGVSRTKPTTISDMRDYIYSFMANTTTFPCPRKVTFNQTSKTGTNAASYGNATITLEKMDNSTSNWGDDFNCYLYITVKMMDDTESLVSTVTSKYNVICENSTYVYTGTITGSDGTSLSNITYTYKNGRLVTTDTSVPDILKKLSYSDVENASGSVEITDSSTSVTYNAEISKKISDSTEYKFIFLERL